MVTMPAKRNRPIAPRTMPSQGWSGRRRLGTAATGTTAEPLPSAPLTATVTLFEPGAMIQRRVAYQPAAPRDRLGHIRRRRARAGVVQVHHGGDLLGPGVHHLYVDVGDPGNDPGQADVHHDVVGPRGPLVPHVRAAYVGRAQGDQAREPHDATERGPHRITRDIPLPHQSPTRADPMAKSAAKARPRASAGASRLPPASLGTLQNRCCQGPGWTM